jgi:hypothetical protein
MTTLTNLKGTDKQIAYANSLYTDLVRKLDSKLTNNKLRNEQSPEAWLDAAIELLELVKSAIINRMMSYTYASDLINDIKNNTIKGLIHDGIKKGAMRELNVRAKAHIDSKILNADMIKYIIDVW